MYFRFWYVSAAEFAVRSLPEPGQSARTRQSCEIRYPRSDTTDIIERNAYMIYQTVAHGSTWITDTEIVLESDAPSPPVLFPGTPVGAIEGVREVQRTSGHLV